MAEQLVVAHPDYWNAPVKPRNFIDFCEMVETHGKITGLWEWRQWNPKTGETVKREWNKNVVTDDGAIELFKCAITNAVPAAVFNNIYINNNSGSSTLTALLTNGVASGTTLSVAALPAAVPLDYPSPINTTPTVVQVGYGSGTTQNFTINGASSQGGTSLTVLSQTANATYGVGTAVVPLPNAGENPSNVNLKANQSTVVEKYSGNLSAGAYTYNATTGAGNRNVVVTFTFANATNGGSTSNGSYTDAWLVNVSSAAAAGNYVCHEINTPMTVNNSNNVTVTITIKI